MRWALPCRCVSTVMHAAIITWNEVWQESTFLAGTRVCVCVCVCHSWLGNVSANAALPVAHLKMGARAFRNIDPEVLDGGQWIRQHHCSCFQQEEHLLKKTSLRFCCKKDAPRGLGSQSPEWLELCLAGTCNCPTPLILYISRTRESTALYRIPRMLDSSAGFYVMVIFAVFDERLGWPHLIA